MGGLTNWNDESEKAQHFMNHINTILFISGEEAEILAYFRRYSARTQVGKGNRIY